MGGAEGTVGPWSGSKTTCSRLSSSSHCDYASFIGCEYGMGCAPASIRSSKAGPRSGGRPGGGPATWAASASAYSPASAGQRRKVSRVPVVGRKVEGWPLSGEGDAAGEELGAILWRRRGEACQPGRAAAFHPPRPAVTAATVSTAATAAGRPVGEDHCQLGDGRPSHGRGGCPPLAPRRPGGRTRGPVQVTQAEPPYVTVTSGPGVS